MANIETLISSIAKAIYIPPAAFTISPRKPLPHQSNCLYDLWAKGQHLILKEFLKPEEFDTSPEREFRALELLARSDIAPQPVFFQPQKLGLNPIVIYEFLDGEMWDRTPPSAAQLSQLAELWLEMHRVTHDDLWLSRGYGNYDNLAERFDIWFQTYLRWAADGFPSGLAVTDIWQDKLKISQEVNRACRQMSRVEVFCRADPRFANVIQRPNGRLGMVDWEDSGLRDPAMDIADMITHPNQEDLLAEADWQGFLIPYLDEREPLDPGIMDRVYLYCFLFSMFRFSVLLGYGAELARDGKLHGWKINGMPANQRLRRFWARILAWPKIDFNQELEQAQEFTFFPLEG